MADKRCDNGHFIDQSWDICPYCPQDLSEPEIPVVRPHSIELRPAPVVVAVSQPSRAPAAAGPAGNAVAADLEVQPENAVAALAELAMSPPPMERTVAGSKLDLHRHDAHKRYVVGWLVALDGPTRGESFALRMGRNVIGRDRRCDVVINDDQASSHHADLVFRPDERRFILMDHNSTNGTYVNETEIEPRRDLAEKDIIRIGSHRFLFSPLCHEGMHWDDEGPLK